MSGEPGRSYAVTDSFYGEDFTYTLVRLAYHTALHRGCGTSFLMHPFGCRRIQFQNLI